MKRKMRRKLQSIFSIFLCVLMIVPNITTAYAYDEPAVVEDYTDNTEDSSEEDTSFIITSNGGEDESEEVLSEEHASEEIESEEQQSEEKSEIESEEQNSEDVSEEENSEKTSEEENSEKASEEKSSEEDSSEKTSEELNEEDTKKSNIEITLTEGVTVIINDNDTEVAITRHEQDLYYVNKAKNSDYDIYQYDDKFIINDFDIDADIDISLLANEDYILTDYSISNDDETIVEESDVEKFEYKTQLTTTENVYINIKTDIYEGEIDINTLDDNQKYIYENLNSEYVNKITKFEPGDILLLKSTAADKHKLTTESFEGVFNSNEEHISEAYLYQNEDLIGLYDLNAKSDYLVGKVNLLSTTDEDFTLIDYTFAKSNANGEVLDGAIFDSTTGLVYVPKSLINYLEDGSINIGANQLQILYAFDDGTDNIEIQEIEDEDGNIEEVEVNMAAPKVFMRMAAPALLGASSTDAAPNYNIQYSGRITGNVNVGDTAEFDMPYGYSTERINGWLPGVIQNSYVLGNWADTTFYNQLLSGQWNEDGLIANMIACFPHRLTFMQETTYNFNEGTHMTIYPGVYALECIHTKAANTSSKSPKKIKATILAKNINGGKGYVYVGLTCAQVNSQSGAGIIKLEYTSDEYKEKKGSFAIRKQDNANHNLGAGFKFVVLDEDYNYFSTITTNEQGIAICENIPLPLGATSRKFRIREIYAPDKWKLDSTTYEIYATENGKDTISLTFKDTPKQQIKVVKVDTDGAKLKHLSTCQILDANKNVVVGSFLCGYDPVIIYIDEPGKYYLHETSAGDGYIWAKDVPFTLKEGENIDTPLEVRMVDKYDTVEIEKVTEDEYHVKKPVVGAHLYLYKYDSFTKGWNLYDKWVSDGNKWVLKALPHGDYKIEEHQAPEGYIRNDTPLKFTVYNKKTEETATDAENRLFSFYNDTTDFSILKIDAKTGLALPGAELKLYGTKQEWKNGKYEYTKDSKKLIDSWVSDLSPHKITGVSFNKKYWLEEVTPPPGYDNFGHKLIEFGHQHTDECYSGETVSWPLVYATHSQSGGDLGHELWKCSVCGETMWYWFKYKWYDHDGPGGTEQEHIDTKVEVYKHDVMEFGDLQNWYINPNDGSIKNSSDETHTKCIKDYFPSNGNITIYKSRYLLKEDGTWKTSCIPGSTESGQDPNFRKFFWCLRTNVPTTGDDSGYFFPTTPESSYETINVNTSEPYHFHTGGGIESLRGFHYNCPGNGSARTSWNPADHTNEGELICGLEEQANHAVVKVANSGIWPRGFSVAKVDADTGEIVAGATLAVYKITSKGGEKEKQIGKNFVTTTTPTYFENVDVGWYRVEEIKPPNDYYTIGKPVEFQVKNNSTPYSYIEVPNSKTRVYIQKRLWTNAGGTEEATGAHLQILDPSNNNKVMDDWWTKGDQHEITGLLKTDHEYILHEVKAISGTVNAGDIGFKITKENRVEPTDPDYVGNQSPYKFNQGAGVIMCYNYENAVQFIKTNETGKVSLEGAHLQLYQVTGSGNLKLIDDWWSGQDGKSDSGIVLPHIVRGLTTGTYIWREVQSPAGYCALDPVDQTIEITNDRSDSHFGTSAKNMNTFTYYKKNKPNKAYFYKVDATTGAKLEGAHLSLWKADANGNPSKYIDDWTTEKDPKIIEGLAEGNYVLIEHSAPEGYDYANSLIVNDEPIASLLFTLTNSTEAQVIKVLDPRIRAEFELLKVNGSSGEPITNDTAEFEFLEYNEETKTYEVSQHYWIDYVKDGLYSVFNDLDDVPDHYLEWTPQNQGKFAYRETKAPNGSELDTNLQYIDIKDNDIDDNGVVNKSIVLSNDLDHVCPIHPKRTEEEWTADYHKIFLGHNADESNYLIFTDPELSKTYSSKVFANAGYKGGFELVKYDKDAADNNKTNTAQGDVLDLSGFEFKLYNRSGKAVYVYPKGDDTEKVKVENNGLISVYTCDSDGNIISTSAVSTLVTNSKGYIGIPHESLSSGTYEIIETKAKDGYQLPTEDEKSITFTVAKDDEYFHFEYNKVTNADNIKSTNQYFADKIIRGDVQLTKYDKELNKSEVIGGSDHGNNTISAKLNNIEFEIINKSTNHVYVNNKWYNKDEVVTTITTHWNADKKAYTAETTGNLLPYGTYTIREKTAGEGYIKTDAIQNFEIRNNNEVVTVNTNGELLKLSNQIVRGDVQFKKVSNDTGRLIKAPFLITNVATKEKHIVVTNSQGLYSSGTTHSNNTNGNDALLAKYEADPNYAPKANELDETAGIWFGQGENGSNAPVDDTLGALPYGDYVLQELRSHSNEGLELVTINFSVGKSNETDNPSIDLDIIYDITSDYPGIKSSAVENTSITHVAKAGTTVTIVDRIDLWDLVSEENYKAVGYLIDKKTGNKIKYKGAEVTDEHSFVADGRTENFNLSFTFDTTSYEGSSVVVYVYLYKEGKLEDNDKTKEGVNINNISETVVIPTIHTSLEDEFTKDNVVVVYETAEKSKVIDTVSYKNLAINTATDYAETPDDITENQTYTIKGKLYDKTTNKVVATSEVTFTPTTVDGTVKVPYEFKGENGHTYVATEELYVNNVLVAEHNDLEDEAQTVYSPRGWTEAIDATTGTHAGVVGENQIIKDTVYYENLVIGKTYTIKGTLMDKETNTAVVQKGAPVTASTVFTASKTSGHIELEFVVDTTLFKDKAIVVFEDFYHKNINVYSHADINDENQTITYSDLKTTAIDANTTDNVAVAGTTTIKDKVQCSNLIVGKTYAIKGVLMDKKTGEYLGKDLGLKTPISATKKFTAEAKDQVVEMVFTVDGSKLQGKTCVVFENLYLDDKLISTHEMIDDVDQTVYFPSVHTTAITDTGLKEQLADKGQLIYDKVELNNLVVGKEYTVTGKVYDKTTKEAVKEGNNFITSSQTFTATDAHMIIELKFTIKDASKLNGKTMVVFEKLYHNDYEVATHEDINDFEQSVKYPNLETNACDIKTKLDEIPNDTVTISDEIDYSNLEKGATYTVKGTIYRKDTNKPMLFADGYAVGTTTFIAQSDKATVIDKKFEYVSTLEDLNAALASSDKTTTELGETKSNQVVSGKVEVAFENINAKELYGKTMVVFEYLYRDKILVGIHADINDDNQDIKTLDISTFAREKETGIQELICSKDTHVVDTISITNATEDNTYTITSKIVDINTDEVIATFKDDYKITNKNYVETKDGYKIYNVDIEMTFDSTKLTGRSFVIYEYVQRDNETLALHEDKNDLKQRLYFPNIGTSAKDSETKDSDSLAEKDDTLIDTVKYENLTEGELYYVTGTLMDKETKKPIVIDGKEITSTTYFYAGENKPLDTIPTKTRDSVINSGEKVSGTIDVTFKFDSTSLAGKDIVVFEKAYTFDNIIVGKHEDIDDKNQTIKYPKVGTTLLDKSTESHEGMARDKAVYIDTVKYENLIVGKEYTVTGTLMDKETGKPLEIEGATSSTTFTATSANGEVEVKFTINSSSLGSKNIVCFEDLYRNNKKVAVHADLQDENQTVRITPPPGSPTKYVKVKIAKADKLRTYYMLKGAEITIYNADGTIAKDINGNDCVGVTDENGLVWFHLYQHTWDHYYAKETKAPKGYAICNDKFDIYATDDMSKDADGAYQININVFDMWLLIPPKTGDNLPILPIGLILFLSSAMGVTGVILLRRKRRNQDK